MAEKETNGQNIRLHNCILATIKQHHCTKICKMIEEGNLGTEGVDKSLVKRLRNSVIASKIGTNASVGYDLSFA